MGDKDFFLDPDDSMTMGDINYMRKAKRTRRTFPKTLKNPSGFDLENEVSSVEDRSNLYKGSNTNQNTTVNTVFNPTPSSQSQAGITGGSAVNQTNQPETSSASIQPPTSQTPKRRQTDSSMDMFRNMAKKIRK
ncbi:hypothetical protein [Pleurocapsa sp. PCC 7319]|uniref:hypothetical protein n=1 Tax=Pleurocapsa sp. PCC 7319 TaxID=118161 RepID=UPI00034BF7EA|nr:hypothetical protein [Pleurocapsa sp. PCC 7319]